MTARASFGPLRVSWTHEALDDPLRRLFGGGSTLENDGPVDVAIECQRVDAPEPTPDGPEIFSLGIPKAHEVAAGFAIHDGASLARISSDGRSIALRVYEDGLEDSSAFRVHALPGALAVAARRLGYFHMHAAVMSLDGVGIVVSGDGHAGKSTVASSLLSLGARWGTDDIALFTGTPRGRTRVWGVPRAFHIRPRTAEMFPRLRDSGSHAIGFNLEERWEVDLSADLPERRLADGVAPSMLVFPRIVADAPTSLRPLASADAVTRLMQTSALVIVEALGRQTEQLAALSALAGQSRAFELKLGPDALDDPLLPAKRIRAEFDG